MRRCDDQDFSLADAVSFALMRRRGIEKAFTFDRHFTVAEFTCVPSAHPWATTGGCPYMFSSLGVNECSEQLLLRK